MVRTQGKLAYLNLLGDFQMKKVKLHASTAKMLRRGIEIEKILRDNDASSSPMAIYVVAIAELNIHVSMLYRVLKKYEAAKHRIVELPEYEGMTIEEIREQEGLIEGDVLDAYKYKAYAGRNPRMPRYLTKA